MKTGSSILFAATVGLTTPLGCCGDSDEDDRTPKEEVTCGAGHWLNTSNSVAFPQDQCRKSARKCFFVSLS